jgi:hypothetical protein
MALMVPKRRKPEGQTTEYDFQPSRMKSGLMSAPPPGQVGSDYQAPPPRDNGLYRGNYGNLPANPGYRPTPQTGNTRVQDTAISRFRNSRPSGAQLNANPAAYGVTQQELANAQYLRDHPGGNTVDPNPPFPTVGSPGAQRSNAAVKTAPPSAAPTNTAAPTELPIDTGGPQTPNTGLPIDGQTNTTPTNVPTTVDTGLNPGYGNIPGMYGPLNSQSAADHAAWLYSILGDRDIIEFGGNNGVGGNSIANDGSWTPPSWMSGANANTRQVQDDETVEARLARLSRSDSEINRIAQENARENAAASGMIGGSSAAEGAALRASREALLPIASQDAAWSGQTARDNMDAINRQTLQSQGLMANAWDAATDRKWRSKEANTERAWKSIEGNLAWMRGSADREDSQEWNSWENNLQRDFQQWQQNDQQDFQGNESERARSQERVMAYFSQAFGREGLMAQTLATIYGNEQLTPEQQQAAANNARTIFQSMFQNFTDTLNQGIPPVFTNPFSGSGGGGGGLPIGPGTGTGTGTGPGTYGGYPTNENGIPLLGTHPDGSPIYATLVGYREDGSPIFRDQAGNEIQP